MNPLKLSLWYPVKPAYITQSFGENLTPLYAKLGMKGHNGLDLYATDGEPVRAAHDGEVTFAGEDGSGGLGVVIRTTEQYDYDGKLSYYKTIYWHLKKGSIVVKPNQIVKTGDVLAGADNTGLSEGTHLHFSLKPVYQGESDWTWGNLEQNNGYYGAIDPKPYLNGFFAEDQAVVISRYTQMLELLKQALAILTKSKK